MKCTVTTSQEYEVKSIAIDAGVRYWEDAEIDGLDDDNDNPQMYGYVDGRWKITIDIETGHIAGWNGKTAKVFYKVCDDGVYSLLDSNGNVVVKKEMYVPDILCIGNSGYGDYIIFNVDKNGYIEKWNDRCIQGLIDDFMEMQSF